jgi:acyl carrier protein/catechol 2,3-dioxygenase-like lactoylglutathione lyase family enzyme
MSDTLSRLNEVMRDVFDDDDLVVTRQTTAQDVAGWDSLMHATLIVNLERVFGLRFSSAEDAGIKNVGELADIIDQRNAAKSLPRAHSKLAGPRLHHVGIIVPDSSQVQVLMALLGLRAGERQYVPEYEADCFFTETGGPGAVIEFIVPTGGKLAKFNKGMGGVHHIALEVDDLEGYSAGLAAEGVSLLEDHPVDAGRLLINFLPPAYTRGIIVEFVQTKSVATSRES